MIELYCCRHHSRTELCQECAGLLRYARQRLEKCPFGEGKTTCAKCPLHCYKPVMRQQIREVMRYSGPHMLFRHPVMAVHHLLDGRRKTPCKPVVQKRLLWNYRKHWSSKTALNSTCGYRETIIKWRFNNRENPYLFRDTLKKLIGSENLEYKELTSHSTNI